MDLYVVDAAALEKRNHCRPLVHTQLVFVTGDIRTTRAEIITSRVGDDKIRLSLNDSLKRTSVVEPSRHKCRPDSVLEKLFTLSVPSL